MKVLIIGRWGKTHALAKALCQHSGIELYAVMDKLNGGIAELATEYMLCDIQDVKRIETFAKEKNIDLVLVVPAMALETDITTHFSQKGFPCVGPSKFCTRLEGDKAFLRYLMKTNNIDAYPDFNIFYDRSKAVEFIRNYSLPFAVKPAGITEGDGVKVMGIQLRDKQEAISYVEEIFDTAIGGLPCVIIEEKITGEEFTIQFFCDGKTILPSPVVRDYKLLEEGDGGLNTPGMGSITFSGHSLPFLNREQVNDSVKIIADILNALKENYNEKFKGILSGQYMVTEDGIKLIEINIRPGDSEVLNIVPILDTDFVTICAAIAEERLEEISIRFRKKATVCKYVVPEGFPELQPPVKVQIDRNKFDGEKIHLFQSCFDEGNSMYSPSPRLFAVTGVGDNLKEAYALCEEGIAGIQGEGLFHRRDIGNPELFRKYKTYDLMTD